ncbi:MAG: TetR/AcrR family transcriptional regulator [Micromonosporaceae bacterium]
MASSRRRGPRQRLDIDQLVEVAIGLADSDGLDAVTMRRVAQELRVSPMSLYTYVPGKAELLDLMLDTVYQRMPRRTPADQTWRGRLEAVAHDNRELSQRHPWVAEVGTSRPPLGPGLMAKYEYELRALDGAGLDDVERDAALTYLLGFVASCARAATDARAARHESAMSDEQWWAANQPLLARMFDATAYPTAARVGSAAGEAHGAAYSPDHAYEFGLRRVLDGLGVLIESRGG